MVAFHRARWGKNGAMLASQFLLLLFHFQEFLELPLSPDADPFLGNTAAIIDGSRSSSGACSEEVGISLRHSMEISISNVVRWHKGLL